MENFGKTAVFQGGYGRIGEIQHWRIWPDWGNTALADMVGLGSIGLKANCKELGNDGDLLR